MRSWGCPCGCPAKPRPPESRTVARVAPACPVIAAPCDRQRRGLHRCQRHEQRVSKRKHGHGPSRANGRRLWCARGRRLTPSRQLCLLRRAPTDLVPRMPTRFAKARAYIQPVGQGRRKTEDRAGSSIRSSAAITILSTRSASYPARPTFHEFPARGFADKLNRPLQARLTSSRGSGRRRAPVGLSQLLIFCIPQSFPMAALGRHRRTATHRSSSVVSCLADTRGPGLGAFKERSRSAPPSVAGARQGERSWSSWRLGATAP